MSIETPFSIQGIKIPMLANESMYADLTGGVLDTSLYIPWAQVVESIRLDGANNVTLCMSAGVLRNYTDNAFDPALSYNPSMAATRALVSLLQDNGLNVTITTFAHIANVISGDGSQGAGDRPRPSDPVLWQQNFGASVLGWAQFAQEVGATAFIPFTDETQHLLQDTALTAGWLELIADIRAVYSGHLSTGWYTDGSGTSVTSIPGAIIEQLDSLGIGFFPHLTDDPNASLEALEAAYRGDRDGNDLIQMLEDFASTYGKQVWITDKAFHSFDGASADEARIFDPSIPLVQDLQEQALLYDSFLQAMSENNSGWLAGVSFQNYNNMRDGAVLNIARFLESPLSESPQGKPAETVLASWFLGHEQGVGLVEIDGFRDNTVGGGYHADVLTGGAGADLLIGMQGNDVFHAQGSNVGVTGYVIDLALRGVVTAGVAPIVTVRDAAGSAIVSATVTATLDPAGGPQPGQPFHLVFEVESKSGFTLETDNWAFVDFSSTGNRFTRIESLTINGQPVALGQSNLNYTWSNGEQAGAVDSVHGGMFTFDLSAAAVGAQALTVSADNDTIDGGTGLDTAVYPGLLLAYDLAAEGAAFRVGGHGGEGDDLLLDVERIHFADGAIALDLDGNAGAVAKLLGAVFGSASVHNAAYVGIGLDLLDGGMPPADLANLALGVRLGTGYTNEALIGLIYANVAGGSVPASLVAEYSAALVAGTYTAASLAWFAAELGLNLQNIGFTQLQGEGLAFNPL